MQPGKGGLRKLSEGLLRLQEVSWNFDGARSRSPLSATHFHPARFISQLPSILITLLSEPGDLIVDPFCGSGTTLVEAQRLGRRALGLDINPVSVMISQARTAGIQPEVAEQALNKLAGALLRAKPSDLGTVPATVQLQKWYSRDVAIGLAGMHAEIDATSDADARLIKSFCFSSILMKVCRETRHWGYVCDNTDPKGSPPRDIAEILHRTIREIVEGVAQEQPLDSALDRPLVREGSAASLAEVLGPETVDLIVTSPPYYGVVDYVKSQRLSFEWLGVEINERRLLETGARSKRHRHGAVIQFADELRLSFRAMEKVMKPGAMCAIVFGISPSREFTFEHLLRIFEEVGLELRSDHVRDVSLQRTLKPSVLTERLYVLGKPL